MSNYFNLGKERGMNTLMQKLIKSLIVLTMIVGSAATAFTNSMLTVSAVDENGELEVGDVLSVIFPDEAFREYVYETVLGKGDIYVDATHANHALEQGDIDKIVDRKTVHCGSIRAIESMEGIQYFVALETLRVNNNKLTTIDLSKNVELTHLYLSYNRITSLDVSKNTKLEFLSIQWNLLTTLDLTKNVSLINLEVGGNQLTELDLSMLEGLTNLQANMNPLSELKMSEVAKPNITRLAVRSTNLGNIDLAGYTSLDRLAVPNATNADFASLVSLLISGDSSDWSEYSIVRLAGDAGFVSQDSNGYYVINAGKNATYAQTIVYSNASEAVNNMSIGHVDSNPETISGSAIVDREGNLIIATTDYTIESDGTIVLTDGGEIVTATGKFSFDGKTTIKDGMISTEDDYSFEKNTATYDSSTLTGTAVVGDIETSYDVPTGGTVTINTLGSESTVPAGTVITNDDDVDFVVVGDATVDSEGKITSEKPYVELPTGGTHTVNPDGSITVPNGSVIHNPDGTTDEPIGPTTIGADGTITYSDAELLAQIDGKIDALEDAGVVRATTTEADFAEIQAIIDKIVDPAKKAEGQEKLDAARMEHIDSMLAALDVNADGKIDLDVTLADFADIEDAVGNITNPANQITAQAKVDAAKVQLITDLLTGIDADLATDLASVTAAEYETVQDLISSLSDGVAAKDGLQTRLDETRKDQIIGLIDVLNADPLLAGLDRDADGNIIASKDAVAMMKNATVLSKLNEIEDLISAWPEWCPEKIEAVNYFLEKFGNVYYFAIQEFPTYWGQTTFVSAQISTPYASFTDVYFGDANDSSSTLLTRSLDGGVTGDYIAYEGSTFITLTRSYLETLSNGTYTISVVFGDVVVYLDLVVAKTTTNPNVPNTGVGESILPWLGLMALSAGSITFLAKKKKTEEAVEEVE